MAMLAITTTVAKRWVGKAPVNTMNSATKPARKGSPSEASPAKTQIAVSRGICQASPPSREMLRVRVRS